MEDAVAVDEVLDLAVVASPVTRTVVELEPGGGGGSARRCGGEEEQINVRFVFVLYNFQSTNITFVEQ